MGDGLRIEALDAERLAEIDGVRSREATTEQDVGLLLQRCGIVRPRARGT
jgi:hypothetical protein